MRYKLRTLLIVLAIGPPLLGHIWFTANQDLGELILVGDFVLLLIFALPVVIISMLAKRRRYLLDRDRQQCRRSGFFSDNWPPST